MSIERMDTATESRMLRCVERVIDGVRDGGLSPTDALVKVAEAQELNPEQIRRVGEAYNTSRSLNNHQTKSGQARLEPFELAHPDVALQKLFPANVKTAGEQFLYRQLLTPDRGLQVPNFIEKAAAAERMADPALEPPRQTVAAYATDPNIEYRRFQKQAGHHALQVKQAESEVTRAALAFSQSLQEAAAVLVQNFRTTKFAHLEEGMRVRYGEAEGTKLANVLWEASNAAGHGQTRAVGTHNTLFDYSLSPFSAIDRFVKAAIDAYQKGEKLGRLKEAAPQDPFVVKAAAATPPRCSFLVNNPVKTAQYQQENRGLFPVTSNLLTRAITGLDVSDSPKYNRELAKALDRVEDPDTRDAMRNAKVQALVANLMAEDPVIRTYDKSEVLERFNELAEVAPQLMDKPVALKAMLARSLQMGRVDPFDVGQYAGLNKQVADNAIGNRANLEAMTMDTAKLRPDLQQGGVRASWRRPSDVSQLLTAQFGLTHSGELPQVRYRDPAMALQQQALDLQAVKMRQEGRQFNEKARWEVGQAKAQGKLEQAKLEATTRGQDLQAQVAREGHGVTREGHGVTVRGQDLSARVQREGIGAQQLEGHQNRGVTIRGQDMQEAANQARLGQERHLEALRRQQADALQQRQQDFENAWKHRMETLQIAMNQQVQPGSKPGDPPVTPAPLLGGADSTNTRKQLQELDKISPAP